MGVSPMVRSEQDTGETPLLHVLELGHWNLIGIWPLGHWDFPVASPHLQIRPCHLTFVRQVPIHHGRTPWPVFAALFPL
jgi:hypothetical protein